MKRAEELGVSKEALVTPGTYNKLDSLAGITGTCEGGSTVSVDCPESETYGAGGYVGTFDLITDLTATVS